MIKIKTLLSTLAACGVVVAGPAFAQTDAKDLNGLLKKVRDLGLPLVSVMYVEPKQADEPAVEP